MKQKRLVFAVLLITITICPGCWDSQEIERRAIVVGYGMDAAPQNKVKVTAQLIKIESSQLNIGEKPEKPFVTLTGMARTGFNGFVGLENETIGNLFFGQLKVVIVNNAIAKRGLKQYVDFLERHPFLPSQGYLVLTEGTAQEMLSEALAAKFIPGVAIADFLDNPRNIDQVIPMKNWRFIRKILVGPTDPFLPIISFSKEERAFQFKGIGVFRRDRLVGRLSKDESRMTALLMSKVSNAYLLIPVPGMGEVSFKGVTAQSKMKVLKTKPQLELEITVKVSGHVHDIPSQAARFKNKDIRQIQHAVQNALTKQMRKTIRHLQNLNSDIIGFGEKVRATRPESWKKMKWDEEYPKANIHVTVSFNLEDTGVYR